jgi:outer membrane receptor for Fe3+-dicitrate
MLYGTYSQGYRHAGANAVPSSGKYAENPDYFTFDADTVDNYEIGFKGTAGRQQYSMSAYYIDWQNPQLNTSTPNWGFFAVINGQSASTKGIEIELSGAITDSLSYAFGYTYADSKLTADVYQPAGYYFGGATYTDKIANDGSRLPGTAKNVLNASLMHDITLSNGLNVSTVLSGYYQSDSLNSLGDDKCFSSFNAIGNCLDSPNPHALPPAVYEPDSVFSRAYAEIDGFSLWNLSSTISKDAWSASLYVKNLFNDAGTTGAFPFLLGGSRTSPSQNYYGNNSREYIALPRTFGLTVGYKF